MTSSMLSGERRWASSSRRGGMTVLGKVAVPKPINLPSQRLENHGLDPNVEIVPKGTLSWGSRSSTSTSNAWGSSSLSPNTDGGTSSPSHLSARPSSGGSGTRPSTAGSDRVLEPTANSWGSNSRPSSASGILSSNQSSLSSMRPRSAETRPGSSQLSRFAEPLTENSGAWNAARTTEKLGVTQPKNEEFSLSSGDFPTLGSDKDKSVLNSDLQDHSSQADPDSSSGGLRKGIDETPVIDDVPVNANIKGGTGNSWRRDYQAYNEEGVRPGIEKWQGNSQPFPNAGIPPQHYDAWHGPPVNNPQGCVWFRGPPSGPPFGNPVTPGGFPIEPFPYYRPHMPPTGLANPPPVPPPGAGPRGHHKNGDVYRPHMPDAFIRPGIPIRPGFYPGSMAYEGYYSSPMGYCNSNERDVPFMGMAAGPPVYNRYPNQTPPEPGNSQGRSGGYGNAGKQLASEQVESNHPPDTAGPYRVLLKQHVSDGKNEPTNWEDSETTNTKYVDGRGQPRMTVWENEQRSNYRKNEEMDLRSTHGEEISSQTSENLVSSSSVIKAKFSESSANKKKSDDISARKFDGVASDVLEISPRPSAPKDASLIQKIEGLNAKARDNSSARIKEEHRNKFHAGNAPLNHVENAVGADVVFPARTQATEIINPAYCEMGAAGAEKSGTATSRQTAHGGRGDHRNKGRSNNQDADGWRKKSVIEDSSASSGAQLETSNVLVGDHQISVQTYDRSGNYNQARHIGESVQTRSDPADSHAQRVKLKEIAKQRTKQLQEEEEERTRKQKAKALAKLDELNRRSQAGDGSTQKEDITNSAIHNKLDELQPSESTAAAVKFGAVSSAVNSNANTICQVNDPSISKVEKSPILSGETAVETLKSSGKDPVVIHNQSVALHQDINNADATNALHVHNNSTSKQKRMSYKQKQNLPSEKTSGEKVVSTTSITLKVENETVIDSLSPGIVANEVSSACGSDLPMNSAAVVESSVNMKKKNMRNNKNKQKVEESSSLAAQPSTFPKETNLSKSPVENDKSRASDFELDQGSLQSAPLSKDSNQFSEQHRYLGNEESHGRMNSQWKSQHSRRMPRNMQANRPAEKSHGTDAVMWAPVKPQNKSEIMDESSEKNKVESVNPVKNEQQVHNLKNKRAEMERYIPKPVAKEMAQQGNIQVASSSSQAPTDDSIGKVDSGSQGPQVTQHTNLVFGKVGSGMESKNRDARHTKQGKAPGSWRQRNLTESTNMHEVHDVMDHDSNSELNVQRPTEHHHDQKSEISFVKGQTKHFNDSGDVDGSNNSINDSAALASVPVIKDHASTGRGRRAPFRGHKGAGGNRDVDNKKNSGEAEKVETRISSSEHGQLDVGVASKENRGVGERLMSQWQPKSQASNNHRGNVPIDQNVSPVVAGASKKDSTHDGESLQVSRGKSSNTRLSQPSHDQSVSEKSKAGEALHFGNQESKRERKNAPSKRHHHSPVQVSVTSVEQAPTSEGLLHDQRPSSGSGKNINQNRFRRGHESHGDLKPPTQDNRHYNQPTNRERQGYEYHPVGPYDDGKLDNFERPKNGNHGGGRFRERGQTHPRRGGGNSYGRQGGFESYD
ncbi:protein MODIFIER OF SNC1 1 isoform X2 [Cajanus cajan]|uniref:protein MODIFIER OF SNC1 1 isoform X2 n=1 Tax=Cajanus cajan TaxID=3821 RepID=UPI00098D7814|nr:protein MODIFIER OF SNC1 1 isoform X2 [Cajanus cajan]